MVKVNGWTYDPQAQAWTARVGASRWLVIAGDLASAPSFTPASIA